jgi:cysteine synthase A
MIVNSITDLIGKTPIVDVSSYFEGLSARLLVKVESFNPGGSVKDRIAFAMITKAMQEGLIEKDTQIIEPSSGNTGVGLAMVCAALGLKLTIVMPETMTVERRMLIKAYGSQLDLTPGPMGMKGSIARAIELAQQYPKTFIPMQFENMANPEVHRHTTAKEILVDTNGNVDFFVSGVGTGGTLSGVSAVLKEVNPNLKVIAVEPTKSPVLSGGQPGPHKIYGIGAGFVPNTLDTSAYDQIITVYDDVAFEATRLLAKKTGILAGISSGGAFAVALDLARLAENKGKTVLTLLPDTGERYLSSGVFEGE